MPSTPLHELTEAELNSLSPRLWDGEAEYARLSTTVIPRPPGSTWSGLTAIQLDFPFTFPTHKRQFLTTLLAQYTLYRQHCTACGVPPLEAHEDDEMIFVTQATQIKRRHHEKRLKTAPEDDPWINHSSMEWENKFTADPGGYHLRYTEFNVTAPYPTCTVEQSDPDPPENWDGEDLPDLPDYEDYNWRKRDEPDENSDDSIITYNDFVGACIAGLKNELQSKKWVSSFSLRKAYPVMSYGIPLQGFAGIEDMTARITGAEAQAYKWEADLWATGQRFPFKIVYTQRITWLYDNESHETGDLFSETTEDIRFSHSDGWHHTLSPPLLVGRKTALIDPRIEFFRDGL